MRSSSRGDVWGWGAASSQSLSRDRTSQACTCRLGAYMPHLRTLAQRQIGTAWLLVGLAVSLLLSTCAPHVRYQRYVPSPSSNARVQFEYPAHWQLYEINSGSSTRLELCEPASPPSLYITGVYNCSQVISLFTDTTSPEIPDIGAAISLTLAYAATTPDYTLTRQEIEVGGLNAQRIEVCYTPGGYVVPNPPPTVMHVVYWQVGERIYDVRASTTTSRPCSPAEHEFPVFEHILDTLMLLEP